MAIKVRELHHHGIRIGTTPEEVESARRFYTEVLGLEPDPKRPNLPGVPGYWMFVGNETHTAAIHLMGAKGMSTLARSVREDPALPHVALAVDDIHETKRELERQGIWFWQIQGLVDENSDQVFVEDPFGNIIELHQIGTCRCNKAAFKDGEEKSPMPDELQELKQRLSKLSDEELVAMLTVSPRDYRPEALEYAKAELKYRRVELPEAKPEAGAEPKQEEAEVIGKPGSICLVCGGPLRHGTLVAEKELTIVFSDNQEERFVRVHACQQCGQLSFVADFETEVAQ